MDSPFSYGDKIYMVSHMSWVKKGITKKDGEKGETAVERPLLLSCQWDDIKKITYEKEISEWWYNRAERNTQWVEYGCFEEYSMGEILTLYNGELDKKETGHQLMHWSMGIRNSKEVKSK